MRIVKLLCLSLVAFVTSLALAGMTFAAPITYIFTGTASGTVGSVPFTDAAYTITVQGDTAAITYIASATEYDMLATTVTMTIAGVGTATVTDSVSIFASKVGTEGRLGISHNGPMLILSDAVFITYALAAPLGPIGPFITTLYDRFKNLQSNLGPITMSSTSWVTFQAVLGGPPVIWTGDVSIPFQITSLSVNSSSDTKFQKSSSSFTGTVEMYISDAGPQRSTEGCYVKLKSDDGSEICIDQIANISTDVQKSKSEQGLLVGMGTMTMMFGGIPSSGIAYLDVKETLKKDASGKLNSISLNGKMSGGTNDVFVLTGNVKSTLTK
jgi:hypothetical protein